MKAEVRRQETDRGQKTEVRSQKSKVNDEKCHPELVSGSQEMPKQVRHDSSGGFTLLEVIVAMSILSICLVLVMQLFAGGLRASRTSCDYTRAIVHAKDKMGEVMETSASDLNSGSVQGSGEFKDGFKWEAEVQPFRDIEDTPYKLYKLLVKVKWNDGQKNDRAIELVTLKTVSTESVQ